MRKKTGMLAQMAACLVLAVSAATSTRAQEPTFAVTGVAVVDVVAGSLLENRTVVIEDGRIRSVELGGPAPAGARVIDGRGHYLIPGLWDMHVHLRRPDAPTLFFPQFLVYGVTGVRDMNSDCNTRDPGEVCLPELRAWQEQIESGAIAGPRLLALSSFSINPPWEADLGESDARGLAEEASRRGVDLIKIYFRLSPDAFRWLMEEAGRAELDVAGHVPIRVTATDASNAGLRSLEHARDFLFDCFPGTADFRATTQSQNPSPDVMRSMVDDHDIQKCAEVFRTFVRNGTWYVPTHVTRRMDAYADDLEFRNDPRARYVPAPVWAAWQEDADRMVALDPTPEGRRVMRGFYERGLEITGRAHEAGVNIVAGTDAGDTYVFPGSGLHDELHELVKAGLSPAQALAAATIRAAEFLRLDRDFGSISPGKIADLVLLSSNPLSNISATRDIQMLWFDGRLTVRTELDAMLEAVEEGVAGSGTEERDR